MQRGLPDPGPEQDPPRERPDIRIWRATLDAQLEGWLPAALALLSDDERARHARYVREQDGRLFALARSMARVVLGRCLGVPPRSIGFEAGPHGKPHLSPRHRSPCRFNVTHSGSVAMIAVTVEREVGIDIEVLRPVDRLEALVRATFSDAEQRGILAAPDRHAAFFATWTRKEAVIKALGHGLRFPLAAFDVSVDPDARPVLLASRDAGLTAANWTLHPLPAITGYACALAVEREAGTVLQCREWVLDPSMPHMAP